MAAEIRAGERHEAATGWRGDFSPGGSWPAASIASCKVTAVKFSAPPLNFSGIPIYSAVRMRIYLFRASSHSLSLALSLSLSPFSSSFLLPCVSSGFPSCSVRPCFSRSHSLACASLCGCSQVSLSLSVSFFPSPFRRFSLINARSKRARERASERVHVRRAFVAHARL